MMRRGLYDPFYSISGEDPESSIIPASIHIGVVKGYIAATKTCMVTVSSVSGNEPIGPMQIMRSMDDSAFVAPEIGDIVVVGFIDGSFNNAVVLGKIHY